MANQSTELRCLVASVCRHQGPDKGIKGDKGSMQYQLHGSKSMTLKVVVGDVGFPFDDRDECIEAGKAGIEAAIAADLPFSGVFFAYLADAREDQPSDAGDCALAFEQGIEDNADVWVSKRGKLTIGVNKTGQTKKGGGTSSRRPENTRGEDKAIAAFLKRK